MSLDIEAGLGRWIEDISGQREVDDGQPVAQHESAVGEMLVDNAERFDRALK